MLILAHRLDAGAVSVAARLRKQLGPASLLWVAPEHLAIARWSHRIDVDGRARTRLVLPGGRVIESDATRVVWNRLRHLAQPQFRRASPRDIDYASAELQAVVVSWLAAFGEHVVPDVRRHPWPCLPAGWPERRRWALSAAGCGLAVDDALMRLSPPGSSSQSATASRVLVAGKLTVGPLAAMLGPCCQRTAAAVGVPLLEFRFAVEGATSRLTDIEPMPLLLEADAAEAVAAFLLDRALTAAESR